MPSAWTLLNSTLGIFLVNIWKAALRATMKLTLLLAPFTLENVKDSSRVRFHTPAATTTLTNQTEIRLYTFAGSCLPVNKIVVHIRDVTLFWKLVWLNFNAVVICSIEVLMLWSLFCCYNVNAWIKLYTWSSSSITVNTMAVWWYMYSTFTFCNHPKSDRPNKYK